MLGLPLVIHIYSPALCWFLHNPHPKYKLIINATALIDADSTLNITPAVLAKVNELYAADKKAAKK